MGKQVLSYSRTCLCRGFVCRHFDAESAIGILDDVEQYFWERWKLKIGLDSKIVLPAKGSERPSVTGWVVTYEMKCLGQIISNNGSIANSYSPGDYHMTDEEFFEFAKDADYWIYTSYNWDTIFDKFKDNLTDFKSVQNEEVFDTYGKGSAVWFEQRIAEAGKYQRQKDS